MKQAKIAFCAVAASIILAIAFGLFMPVPDWDGEREMKSITVGPFSWVKTPLAQAIDEVNSHLSRDGSIRSRILLAPSLDDRKVSLLLERLPANECARYLTESTGLFLYWQSDGVIIDRFHQDHRSWQRRYRDWIRHILLKRWYGQIYTG